MTNVLQLPRTGNSSVPPESTSEPGCSRELQFLPEAQRTFAKNLIRDWEAQKQFLDGVTKKSSDSAASNLLRLINHAKVAPWELRSKHVVDFLSNRTNPLTSASLSPATIGVYSSSWRSFQNFMLDLDRVNEIALAFNSRPTKFVTDENCIAVKRHKAGWVPKAWALSPAEIDLLDAQFLFEIEQAYRSRSKALIPLQRDRVMFHLAIHFAMRVSELVTCQVGDFKPSTDRRMAHFGNFAGLTITGKNDVTGTVPMREPDMFNLLQWYLGSVRQKLLLRRKDKDDGTVIFDGKKYLVSQLLFPSERGSVVCPAAFRKRLVKIAVAAGVIARKVTPHTLRHTGCTLMVPLYSPEIAQKYMRHKNLYTTLYYYHPQPLDAANEANLPLEFFDDEDF